MNFDTSTGDHISTPTKLAVSLLALDTETRLAVNSNVLIVCFSDDLIGCMCEIIISMLFALGTRNGFSMCVSLDLR